MYVVLAVAFASTTAGLAPVRIPGTKMAVPAECVFSVKNGELLTEPLESLLPSHCFDTTGDNSPPLVNQQVYALDVQMQAVEVTSFTSMTASWVVPHDPSSWGGFDNINYLWPGFKASKPVIGFPVIQPVLMYGENGASWQIQSWFVNQQRNGAPSANAPPVFISAGDTIDSFIRFNSDTQYWTIVTQNRRTGENSNLTISFKSAANTTCDWAMLVFETIMPDSSCNLLPSSGSMTFTNITVDDKPMSSFVWGSQQGRTDCNLSVAPLVSQDSVRMTWAHKSKKSDFRNKTNSFATGD